MKYRELQHRLKQYKAAGFVNIKLNDKKLVLEAEYQRCLTLEISQDELETRTSLNQSTNLNFIDAFDIYTSPEKFSLQTIKDKTYQLAKVFNLQELKEAFPIIKDKKFNFSTKKSWSECIYLIEQLTKGTQDLEKFQREVEAFVTSIKAQKYHGLKGDLAAEEAYNDLFNYISEWKGTQWEFNLSHGASTQDLLKRAWLEQYLYRHKLGEMLKYDPNF